MRVAHPAFGVIEQRLGHLRLKDDVIHVTLFLLLFRLVLFFLQVERHFAFFDIELLRVHRVIGVFNLRARHQFIVRQPQLFRRFGLQAFEFSAGKSRSSCDCASSFASSALRISRSDLARLTSASAFW